METTIKRTLKGKQMEMIFASDSGIRYYEALNIPNDESYSSRKSYKFSIVIRHPEETNANILFDEMKEKMFPTKPKKEPKRKVFLVSTEVGRHKGKISFYIAEIVPNKGLRLIDNDYTCSTQCHKGIESEAVQALVNKNELPIIAITERHHLNPRVKNYVLVIVEGRGLNYINQIN
jgi:hypothetical protein